MMSRLTRTAIVVIVAASADTPRRFAKDNVLVSTALPEIQVRVNKAFRYIGRFDFTIPGTAKGERYVFAEVHGQRIARLFIAQFEAILPESDVTYNYSFDGALSLGGHKFRQNTYAFSNRQAKQENPGGEAALTADFLARKGLAIADELMMSRFVTVPDARRKHELILFYVEEVRASGHSLREFYEGESRTPIWDEISRGLTER